MRKLLLSGRFLATTFVVLIALMGASTKSFAQTGHVRLHIVKAGFIVGVGGGSGTLTFEGRTYRLNVGGIGIGSLGIAGVDLVGTASNLHRASDIAGTYGAAGGGAAFVAGAQAVTLQNERGVVLRLAGPQVGFQVSLGLAGMTLSMR
jgi:hypothetical protein